MGINYGYIRVSASDQNESRQLYAMEKNGIKQKNIFVDKLINSRGKILNENNTKHYSES